MHEISILPHSIYHIPISTAYNSAVPGCYIKISCTLWAISQLYLTLTVQINSNVGNNNNIIINKSNNNNKSLYKIIIINTIIATISICNKYNCNIRSHCGPGPGPKINCTRVIPLTASLLIFKICKFRNIHFVGNLFLSTTCEFHYDDVIIPTSLVF